MSINLQLLPKGSGFQDPQPCIDPETGKPYTFGHLDSRILSDSSWWAAWVGNIHDNTPAGGLGRGCGLVTGGRGNFISEDGSIGVQGFTSSRQYDQPVDDGISQGCLALQAWALSNNFNWYYINENIPDPNNPNETIKVRVQKAKMPTWGAYIEARQYANGNSSPGQPNYTSGATFGLEIDLACYGNVASPVKVYGNPLYLDSDGLATQDTRAYNLALGTGGGDLAPAAGDPPITDASACIVMGSNNFVTEHDGKKFAKYLRGIVIRGEGIREPAYEAIVMASDYNICWYRYLGLDYVNREVLGASISGDATGNGSQMALSLMASNADGVQQEIAFNRYSDNSFSPQYPNISLGSPTPDNQWAELWTKKLILPTTAAGGNVDGNGKPQYNGYTGEVRIAVGSVKRRLYICLGDNPDDPGNSLWGRINITV